MLESLFGSVAKEKLLMYLLTHQQAYPREMAAAFGYDLFRVQNHLARFEDGGVVYSRLRGKVRLYSLSPRYPFRRELEALLRRVLRSLPRREREGLYTPRLRPRRAG